MGEQNGEQGEREGQASSEGRRMLVKQCEGVEKLVERNSLIPRVSEGKLSTGDEASAKSKKKQDTGEKKHLERRARGNGLIRLIAKGNGAPIQVDGNGRWRILWEWRAHEAAGATKGIDMHQYSTIGRVRASFESRKSPFA